MGALIALCVCCSPCCAQLTATIRDGTGDLRLVNSGSTPFDLVGYTISFPTADLQTSEWAPITFRVTGSLDLSGTSFANASNDWTIVSPAGPTSSDSDDLSELTFFGPGGTLQPGERLYLGGVWDSTTSPFVTINVANADDDFSFAPVTYLSQGDYNEDGLVDAKDYNVWRDSLGNTGLGLMADGDGNGLIDASDYEIWRSNLGATTLFGSLTAPAALTSPVNVPEPSAQVVLLASVLLATGLVIRNQRC